MLPLNYGEINTISTLNRHLASDSVQSILDKDAFNLKVVILTKYLMQNTFNECKLMKSDL